MENLFTAEQLENMSIFELRNLARRLGHTSPTDKRKAELVEFVLGCDKIPDPNEIQPVKRKRGRPPKDAQINIDFGVPELDGKAAPKAKPGGEDSERVARPAEMEYVYKPRVGKQYANTRGDLQQNIKSENNVAGFARNSIREYNRYDKTEPRQDNRPREDKRNYYGDAAPQEEVLEEREGVLEICQDGYGFLRSKNYEQGDKDAYIAAPKIRKAGLRKGDYVVATAKKLAENRPLNVQDILMVNGERFVPNVSEQALRNRPVFESLVPIYPDERYKLELATSSADFAIRAIDLVAPIGKGQRAMIVSPPKAGKTTLLKKIANSISVNYPDAHLMVLLVDERPEEVTDMQRSIRGEVIYSTFDEMPEHHTKASELVLERAKRLVESGKDVVILMDSLTRLARAYNLTITPTGKTLSGGIDPGSLHAPKRFFGAARNIENGGSLTIIATALVDTGSRMDDVIYEEFKGTGNMEIHLDRKLSEKRIFPAIDLNRSGTRREELLLNQQELEGIWAVRKMLSAGDVQEATENLIQMMMRTKTNREFIEQLRLQIAKLQKDGFSFA